MTISKYINKEVHVYRNLNKKTWSIKYSGLVVGYSDSLILENVSFKVSEAGRQRVIKERRKNVHAYSIGTLISLKEIAPTNQEITYNPYFLHYFYLRETEKPIYFARKVIFCQDKLFLA